MSNGLVWSLFVLVLVILVLLPLYHLIIESLRTDAGFSLVNYAKLLETRRFHEALFNSVYLGLACGIIGMLLGVPMAWLVSRTNMPLRRLIGLGVLGTFVTPGFVNALAWILLAGPNAGLLNKAWMAATGSDTGLFNIFSMTGLVFVSLATVYPLAFLFMYNAFDVMDTEVEDAARILGARTPRIFLTVTLPLAWPAVVAGFILMFLESLILYGVPAFIGVPARVYVITTQIFFLFEYPPQVGLAAALSFPLLLITAVLLWFQRRWLARRTYATVTGRGGQHRRIDLGGWRWPTFGMAAVVVGVTFVLPTLILLRTSLLRQSFRGWSWENLTLGNYFFVLFTYDAGALSIWNSLVTSTVAATVAVVISIVIAYLTARKLVPFGPALAFLATLPLVIPAMVFAVGLFAAYSSAPVMLYGTLWILILAYLTKHLPFAFMSCHAAVGGIHQELESAASVLGASRMRVLRDVTGPLVKNGLLAGWILVFTPSVKELSASVLLYTSRTTVIPTAIMDAYLHPRWEAVAALSVILLAINAAVVLAGYRLLGRNVLGQRGG
ncbi:MAG: ABC transporter permease [Candidatus Rokuibacteriota bacterium]